MEQPMSKCKKLQYVYRKINITLLSLTLRQYASQMFYFMVLFRGNVLTKLVTEIYERKHNDEMKNSNDNVTYQVIYLIHLFRFLIILKQRRLAFKTLLEIIV